MDPKLLEQLKQSQITINQWHRPHGDEHLESGDPQAHNLPFMIHGTTITIRTCNKDAEKVDLHALRKHLIELGITNPSIHVEENEINIVDKRIKPKELPPQQEEAMRAEVKAAISQGFREVDTSITDKSGKLYEPVDTPGCEARIASLKPTDRSLG